MGCCASETPGAIERLEALSKPKEEKDGGMMGTKEAGGPPKNRKKMYAKNAPI